MPSIKILLPQFGMGMQEAEIVQWLKEPGDVLEAGDPLVEIEAEKTTVEVPSPAGGKLVDILYQPGETVEVRTHIATLETL
jgi:pyruvate/2-oxoglutarate dehydrogenase complex dihydrolipoamide acyltransferase (E2) component